MIRVSLVWFSGCQQLKVRKPEFIPSVEHFKYKNVVEVRGKSNCPKGQFGRQGKRDERKNLKG